MPPSELIAALNTCEVQVEEGLGPDGWGGGGQGLQIADVGHPTPQIHIDHLQAQSSMVMSMFSNFSRRALM